MSKKVIKKGDLLQGTSGTYYTALESCKHGKTEILVKRRTSGNTATVTCSLVTVVDLLDIGADIDINIDIDTDYEIF